MKEHIKLLKRMKELAEITWNTIGIIMDRKPDTCRKAYQAFKLEEGLNSRNME